MNVVVVNIIGAGLFLVFGVLIGTLCHRLDNCAGELLIDKTGETDRWTFFFDKPIEEVEKAGYVWVRVKVKE